MLIKWLFVDSSIVVLHFEDEEDFEHFIKNNPKIASMVL